MALPSEVVQLTNHGSLTADQSIGASRASVTVTHVSKLFQSKGRQVQALDDVSLEVQPGEIFALVGASGCGKSTLLSITAGLLEPTSGTVAIEGTPIRGPSPHVGLMFQESVLLPWRTAFENVMLPVEILRRSRRAYEGRALELLSLMGLSEFKDARPHELSGGMQQRLALCRVLVYDPKVLLLDEPFGALDEFTRESMNCELLRVRDETGKAMLLVTHSIMEAVFLANRVGVMSSRPGRLVDIVEIDLPEPRTPKVMATGEFLSAVVRVRELLGLG